MSLKDWIVRKLIERELDGMRKEGKLSKLWAFLDGKKRLLGALLSVLAILADGFLRLVPVVQQTLPDTSKVVVYTLAISGVLTYVVGVLHRGWVLYYHEEHA